MEMNFSRWETAKKVEDLSAQVAKVDIPYPECEHSYEDIETTFERGGWVAYKQCRKCGKYLFKKVGK